MTESASPGGASAPRPPREVILRLAGLSRRFGGVQAVRDVSLEVRAGEVLGIIGPNGAGKTTLFNLIAGVERPDAGMVHFQEHEITRLPAFRRARLGLGRTFQNLQVFGTLSVAENVAVAALEQHQPSFLRALAGRGLNHRRALARAHQALTLVDLAGLADRPAADLSFGQQRRLELARALALDPVLLLLDEPAAGLGGAERDQLGDVIRALRDRGLAVILIEHDVPTVMGVADRVVVLDQGRKIAEGGPAEVAADPAVIEAYLGGELDEREAGGGPPPDAHPLLQVDGLRVYRGSVRALDDLALVVRRGELLAIIGPNGAGKSTLLGALAGLYPVFGGTVRFGGRSVLGQRAEELVRLGISLVPERRQIFEPLTVQQNLVLGGYVRYGLGGAWGPRPLTAEQDLDRVYALFPILRERRGQPAGSLSGGQQQMLAIGRALMARPKLLLLDEPSLGLAPMVVTEILGVLEQLRGEGTTIVMVEQNARAALSVADRSYVLDRGRVDIEGPAHELLNDPRVNAAYLGAPAR